MRPHSSKKKTPILHSPKPNKSKSKSKNNTAVEFDPHLSSSRKLNNTRSRSKNSLLSLKNPIVMNSLKTMGIIHAYKPSLLKECILNEKASFQKYESSSGECNLNNIFIRTALLTFKDWREKINNKLTLVLDAITESDEILEPQLEARAKEVIQDLKAYSLKLSQQIEKIIALKDQSYKMSKLREKYTILLQTLSHVLKLIGIMEELNREVNAYLEGTKNSDFKNVKALEEGVRRISERYEERAGESLDFCGCHPDNKMLLRLEHKVRRMFKSSALKVVSIFQSILELQKYEEQFKQQLSFLQGHKDFSHEYLVYSLQILYGKNEELKLLEKKVLLSKQPEFVSLRNRMEDWQTSFIKKMRSKSILYLKSTLAELSTVRTLHLFKHKGKEYTELKKQLLLLAKIYQESQAESNINADYYQAEKKSVDLIVAFINSTLATLFPLIELILTQAGKLESLRAGKSSNPIKQIEKCSEELDKLQKAQCSAWTCLNELYVNACRLEGTNAQLLSQGSYEDKRLLQRLHSILIYSRNEQKNNDIFQQLALPTQQNTPLLKAYQDKYATHLKFAQGQLQAGLEKCKELKSILREELVSFLFENEFTSEFIMGYPSLWQVCLIEERVKAHCPKEYINSGRYYGSSGPLVEEVRRGVNEQIGKLEKSRHRSTFNKYIVFIYENLLVELLNMGHIHSIFASSENNLRPYSNVLHQYVQAYASLFASSTRSPDFNALASQTYEMACQLDAENKLAIEYGNSYSTGQYFPSCTLIQQWMDCEFSAEVDQTLPQTAVINQRSHIKVALAQYLSKLEGQRQKLGANKVMAESKDIYRHITANAAMLRQFTLEENYQELLVKVIQYLKGMGVNHSAIFTQDQSPIWLFLHPADEPTMSRLLLSRMHIKQYNNNSFLTSFQPTLQSHPASKPSSPIHQVRKEEQMGEIQEYGEEYQSLIEDMPMEASQNLPVSSVVKAEVSRLSVNTLNQSSITSHTYYKLNHIGSLEALKQGLSYLNNEYSAMQSMLRVDILCSALLPSSPRHELRSHLSQIMAQVKKHDFLQILKIKDAPPQSQQKIRALLQAIDNGSDLFSDRLADLLDFLQVESKLLYSQGANRITSYSKYKQPQSFLLVELSQNCYKAHLSTFHLDRILQQIWIHAFQPNAPSLQPRIHSLIEHSNSLIHGHYKSISLKLSVSKPGSTINEKESEDKIGKFINLVTNNRYRIGLTKSRLASFKEMMEFVGQFQREISNLTILQPYYTLYYNSMPLYLQQSPFQDQSIASSLNLTHTPTLSACLASQGLRTTVSSAALKQMVLSQISSGPISLSTVSQYLESQSKQILKAQVLAASNTLQTVKHYIKYAKVFDTQLGDRLVEQEERANKKIGLLNFLLEQDVPLRVEEYSYNKQIRLKELTGKKKDIRYYDPQFLLALSQHLTHNSIQHHLLHFGRTPIQIMERFDSESVGLWLSLNPQQTALLLQNTRSHLNSHTILKLIVTFVNLIPSLQSSEGEVEQQVEEYLQFSELRVHSGKSTYSKNCLQLRQSKSIEVEVDWPKNRLEVQFNNPQHSLALTIHPSQYHYFSQIELLPLHQHLRQVQHLLHGQAQQSKRRREEEAHRQRVRREEEARQLLQLEQERELSRLKNQQEMARIKFETEEINRKLREKEAEERVRLKFLEEALWRRLQEEAEESRAKEKRLMEKLNCIFNEEPPENPPKQEEFQLVAEDGECQAQVSPPVRQQYELQDLEFEVVLSEGEGEVFREGKHCKEYDYEYEYTKTLYEHIREKHHLLRKKEGVDVERWLYFF